MNKTLLSLLCCLSMAGLCKAEIPREIIAVIASDNDEKVHPLIKEQLRHEGTKQEWNVILDRIQQIKNKLDIDVKIVFHSARSSQGPPWCLFTPNTRIEEVEGRNVIRFMICYDINLASWNRPKLDIQNALQAVAGENALSINPCELPPYIMLSHEMLHMLLRLEYILADRSLSIQQKVADIKNGNLKLFNEFLGATYPQLVPLEQRKNFFELWGAGETQREELIVMLGGRYTVGTETFILGETQFLREYHGEAGIISWTHFLFEMIANTQGEITHRKFLANAFQPENISACLEAFQFLTR